VTTCKVKIFVLRLPQHDLLAIADGGARATGAAQTNTCLSTVGTAIVREKLRRMAVSRLGPLLSIVIKQGIDEGVITADSPDDQRPSPVEVMRKLGGYWPDRELAVTMNRMRCKSADGGAWTVVRVKELRERLKIPPFDPQALGEKTTTVDETARRLEPATGYPDTGKHGDR